MKKILYIIILTFYSAAVFGKGNTRISGTVRNAKDSILNVRVWLGGTLEKNDHEFITKTGSFDYSFTINEPTKITIIVNNKFIFFPGVYSILLEPGDDIHIDIPEMKTASFFGFGIQNVNFSGKGVEKINLFKNSVSAILKLYDLDPEFEKQSLSYQYESADRKLNTIDSVFNNYHGNISVESKNIMKAILYSNTLDMVLVSSVRSESDSLKDLFNKYIVKKNRMNVFFEGKCIYYEGDRVVSKYVKLLAFDYPVYVGGENFSGDQVNLAKIYSKFLKDQPHVKDYFLSNMVLAELKENNDFGSKKLFDFYFATVNANNPLYSKVIKMYDYVQRNLSIGKPFFKFSLPDTTGKVHHLEDFKGKVLVFDFWFNGCVGCKEIAPFMEEIEKEYLGKNVQFVSVSIDKREGWLAGIGKYCSKSSLQLYTEEQKSNHPFIKHLNFTSYPRLIVVDKNGNMGGTPPDPRSDKAGFKKFIDKFL